MQNEKDVLKTSLYLQIARLFYDIAFENDTSITDVGRVLYLLGELNRRLGNDKDAIFYLGRVINDKSINDPGIIRMSRERWQDIREDG